MKFFYLILALILIALAVLQNLLWLAALFAVVFTYFFGAIPLFILAVLVDGYFGAFGSVPVFSLIAVAWYCGSELIRLRMRIME